MRLSLGSAQFGLDYGVANKNGKISKEEISNILDYAFDKGVISIDTAINYGDAEKILGEYHVRDWQVVTKIPSHFDLKNKISDVVSDSINTLNVSSLYGVLLHNAEDLLENNGREIYKQLNDIKQKGLVKKIGVSIYSPDILEKIYRKFPLDIIQAPFNILDQRFLKSGWLSKAKELGIELHVRSIFLQGLLLMEPENRPKQFDKWKSIWSEWDEYILKTKKGRAEICLQWALSFNQVDKVIVGIDSLKQLKSLLEYYSTSGKFEELKIDCNDPLLLDPFNWSMSNV